jgi:hypothetical protein
MREKYLWLVTGGWFVVREKYWWLISQANRALISNCARSQDQGGAAKGATSFVAAVQIGYFCQELRTEPKKTSLTSK